MIADSSFLIDALRGDEDAADLLRKMQKENSVLMVPTPVLFELWEGVERNDRPHEEQRRVEELLQGYPLLPFEPKHAQRAGRLSGELVRKGQMLDSVDAQIAGTALVEGLPLITRNKKDFGRVPGLKVVPY